MDFRSTTSKNEGNKLQKQPNNQHDCSGSISCNSVSSSSLQINVQFYDNLIDNKIHNYEKNSSSQLKNNLKNSSNGNNSSCSSNSNSSNSNSSSKKRKRPYNLDDKDNNDEIDNPTQPAKRSQIMSPSIKSGKKLSETVSASASSSSSTIKYYYHSTNSQQHENYQTCDESENGSVSSSYPSEDLPTESDIPSCSSECLSTVAEYDVSTPSPDEQITLSPSTSSLSSRTSNMNKLKWERTTNNDTEQSYKKSFTEFEQERSLTPTPETRPCPLPALSWANSQDVWNAMCRKDELAAKERNSKMLERHPGLQPRMRAILLDWLIEVCEVYKLHRETYYLAVDYLDRYLSKQTNVQKTHLQLIGITCLFVAAKLEEIYPPKIGEFAYVTDGACREEDIINYEILLLSALEWDVSPVTIMGWLGIYMQLNSSNRTASSFTNSSTSEIITEDSKLNRLNNNNNSNLYKNNSSNLLKKVQDKNFISCKDNNVKDSFKSNTNNNNSNTKDKNNSPASTSNNNNNTSNSSTDGNNATENDSGISLTDFNANTDDAFIYPQFSAFEFVQTSQIIDLCTYDLSLGDYPYSIIAAAAISHTFGRETAMRVSGYEWNLIAPCAKWMEPFFQIISEESKYVFLTEQNEQIQSKFGLGHICPNIVTDDSHMIQSHTTSLAIFDKAIIRHEQNQLTNLIKPEASPAFNRRNVCPEGLLTPPASNRKPNNDETIENEEVIVGNSSSIS